MEENIKHLKDKLKSKQKELEDYVLDINNDCLSEEAEEMRAEIYNLQNEISKKESNYNLVEEDIKKIEEIINWLKDSSYPYDISLTRDDIQSLENLIKGYRELEERELWSTATINGLKRDFIPKSKIKEKIEELEKDIDDLMQNGDVYNDNVSKYNDLKLKIEVLQELMGDK